MTQFPSGTKASLPGAHEDSVIKVENITARTITFRDFSIDSGETRRIDFSDYEEYSLPLLQLSDQGVVDITVTDYETTT